MTHMEWFQRPDGTPVIGEIAQRPPGANISLMTGLAHDTDIYRTPERPATRQSAGWSRRRGDGYEGDGYVVLRDPSTEVVRDALKFVVETVKVHSLE